VAESMLASLVTFGRVAFHAQIRGYFVEFLIPRKKDPGKSVGTLADTSGQRWTCYHIRYHPIFVSGLLQSTWRRGESNPCFDDSYPAASADVLPEGTR